MGLREMAKAGSLERLLQEAFNAGLIAGARRQVTGRSTPESAWEEYDAFRASMLPKETE